MSALFTVALIVALIGWIGARYRGDIARARRRVTAGSRIVDTPFGPIEFADRGNGPALLVVHGAGGGFDQGVDIAADLIPRGWRVIAMSRFGYLRTPVPADASPAAQADAYAALLDALHIPRATVIGVSAGAPSAMQFALRHPDRTLALVLAVPAAFPTHVERRMRGAVPRRIPAATKLLLDAALKSDFLFWITLRLARSAMLRATLGTPSDVVKRADDDERARVALVLDRIQPISTRRLGLLNDAAVVPTLPRYDLERIVAPTLIIAVADDLYGTYAGARYSAEHIPHARLVQFDSGGHLWVGHQQEVMSEFVRFLEQNALSRPPRLHHRFPLPSSKVP